MSLKMYPVDLSIPKTVQYVLSNDVYFESRTLLKDDEVTRRILQDVDDSKRVSDTLFIPNRGNAGSLDRTMLSSGAKTLLNISQYPDVCFNLNECGPNALRLLFSTFHEGTVLWTFNILDVLNGACDVEMEGQHFDSVQALASFCSKLDVWNFYSYYRRHSK